MFITLLLVSVLTVGAAFAQPAIGENVKIYAAAVVKTPLTAIASDFEKTGNKVKNPAYLPAAPRRSFLGTIGCFRHRSLRSMGQYSADK